MNKISRPVSERKSWKIRNHKKLIRILKKADKLLCLMHGYERRPTNTLKNETEKKKIGEENIFLIIKIKK